MDKSVLVAVSRLVRVPKYNRTVTKTRKFMAHDEFDECNVGDTVKFRQTRPISKNKCWEVFEIVHRARVFDADAATRGAVSRLRQATAPSFAASAADPNAKAGDA